jgi:hypothetical protein
MDTLMMLKILEESKERCEAKLHLLRAIKEELDRDEREL